MNKNNPAMCASYRKILTVINSILTSATFVKEKVVGKSKNGWVRMTMIK